MRYLQGLIAGALLSTHPVLSAETTPARVVDPEADRIMERACEQLKSAPAFSVSVDVSYDDVLKSGLTVQYQRASVLLFDRPNHMKIEGDSDDGRRTIVHDGKTITIYNREENMYVQVPVPDSIDATLDKLGERDITLPLDDLISSEPCTWLYEDVWDGYYGGRHFYDDGFIHHLLFRAKDADFQVWIQGGEVPVIRKVVIEYTTTEGAPRYEARLSDWNFRPTIAEGEFTFNPPKGASRIEFRKKSSDGEGVEEGDTP